MRAIKRSALGAAFAAGISILSGVATAAPWIDPGDAGARRDVELLAAHGLLSGPVISWPLPWEQVLPALNAAEAETYPHVRAAVYRLRAKYDRDVAIPSQRIRYTIEAEGASSPQLIRGFESPSRDYAEARIGAESVSRGGSARLNIGVDREVNGDTELNFDGSYAAYQFGNVLVHGGVTEHWWGPGRDGALQLSNNARPFPVISATRVKPEPFESDLLSWVGPWRLTGYVGVLPDDRAVDNPLVAGMRAEAEPIDGLMIGVTRTAQFCGEGIGCGTSELFDTLIGADNNPALETRGPGSGAGSSDQKAGIDVRYSTALGAYDAEVYGEIAGEDQAGFFPSKNAYIVGAGVGGPVGTDGAAFSVYGEYADTAQAGPNVFYSNSLYPSGNSFDGEVIGHSIESDSRLVTVGGAFESTAGWRAWARVGYADLNRDGTIINPGDQPNTFVNAEQLGTLDVGTSFEVLEGRGTLDLGASYVTDNMNSRRRARDTLGGSVRLSLGF